jgi:hypothetical protein
MLLDCNKAGQRWLGKVRKNPPTTRVGKNDNPPTTGVGAIYKGNRQAGLGANQKRLKVIP